MGRSGIGGSTPRIETLVGTMSNANRSRKQFPICCCLPTSAISEPPDQWFGIAVFRCLPSPRGRGARSANSSFYALHGPNHQPPMVEEFRGSFPNRGPLRAEG